MRNGRSQFKGVGRAGVMKKHFAAKPASLTSHPYGDDWPAQSAACKKRDDYRCMAHKIGLPKCSNRFPPPLTHLLGAHHIIRFAKSKDNRLSNLVSLCHECHSKEHGGKHVGYAATQAQKNFSKKLR